MRSAFLLLEVLIRSLIMASIWVFAYFTLLLNSIWLGAGLGLYSAIMLELYYVIRKRIENKYGK